MNAKENDKDYNIYDRMYVSCPVCSVMIMEAQTVTDGIIKCCRCHKKIWFEIQDGKVTAIPLSRKKD